MENNNQNKTLYFAHHYGQLVYRHRTWKSNEKSWGLNKDWLDVYSVNSGYLLLTPLSQITDEDAIEVAKAYKSNVRGYGSLGISFIEKEELMRAGREFTTRLDGNYWNNFANITNMLCAFDLLRSRGYALPFMGLKIEKLIEYGWLKLKS